MKNAGTKNFKFANAKNRTDFRKGINLFGCNLSGCFNGEKKGSPFLNLYRAALQFRLEKFDSGISGSRSRQDPVQSAWNRNLEAQKTKAQLSPDLERLDSDVESKIEAPICFKAT